MIEQYLLEQIQEIDRDNFRWSINHTTQNDNAVTIYSDAGQAPSTYDDAMRFPNYQIYIKSSDFDKAKLMAHQIFDKLQCLNHQVIEVQLNDETQQYYLYFLEAISDIIVIGVNEDDVMELSLNFKATLQKYSNDYQL